MDGTVSDTSRDEGRPLRCGTPDADITVVGGITRVSGLGAGLACAALVTAIGLAIGCGLGVGTFGAAGFGACGFTALLARGFAGPFLAASALGVDAGFATGLVTGFFTADLAGSLTGAALGAALAGAALVGAALVGAAGDFVAALLVFAGVFRACFPFAGMAFTS